MTKLPSYDQAFKDYESGKLECLDCAWNPGLCDTHDNVDTQMANMRINPILAGALGSWSGFKHVEHVAIPIAWRWWSWRSWRHQYTWPGGSDAWYPYVDVDALEDPAYDRLYDTPMPWDFETVKRWASRLFVDLPREIYFGKFTGVHDSMRDPQAVGPDGWYKSPAGEGHTITIDRVVPLSQDAQSTPGTHRRHDRRKPLRPRRKAR